MLAAMDSPQHAGHSQYDTHHNPAHDYTETPDSQMEDRLCPGCKKSAVNENGGLVVAFGCAKCQDQVTADTNLLLLSDGSPICANCSYSCNVCHLPILDEAIMTGDDSYHAHCFKCKVCKTRIDELVFAKTSQGIYCMNCHNERMAKIRRHAQKKKEREREKESKSKERDLREFGALTPRLDSPRTDASFTPDASMRSQLSPTPSRDERSRTNPSSPSVYGRPSPRPPKQNSLPLVSDAFEPHTKLPITPAAISITPETPPRGTKPSTKLNINVAPPTEHGHYSAVGSTPSPSQARFQDQSTVSSPGPEHSNASHPQPANGRSASLTRKKSLDDAIRPLNVLLHQRSKQNIQDQPKALNVPTARADKRRSFQIVHEVNTGSPTHALSASSPRSLSPTTYAPPSQNASTPPTPSSTHENLPPRSVSPQINNSLRDSTSTVFHSPSSSPVPLEKDIQPHDHVRTRAASSSTEHPVDPRTGRPPLRPSVTLDQVPSRSASPLTRDQARLSADGSTSQGHGRFSPTLGLPNGHSLRMQKSFDDSGRAGSPLRERPPSANSQSEGRNSRPGSGTRSRPNSDSRRADVPHGIESGTDTEAEFDEDLTIHNHSRQVSVDIGPPPAPPPKELKPRPQDLDLTQDRGRDIDHSVDNRDERQESADVSDDLEEVYESPVEATSTTTFIAPALPPIRFSMSGSDFSDMLKNVGSGMPSLKTLEGLSKLSDEDDKTPATPPPTAAVPLTPSTEVAARSSSLAQSQQPVRRPTVADATSPLPTVEETPHAFTLDSLSQAQRPHTADNQGSRKPSAATNGRPSTGTTNNDSANVTVTAPDSATARPVTTDSSDSIIRQLSEAFVDATQRGSQQLKLEKSFVDAILKAFEQKKEAYEQLKNRLNSSQRTSQQYVEGLTVAQTEYDQELKARRDAESEVTRLRVLLSGQAARLSTMSGEVKKHALKEQMSQEMSENLDVMERDLSQLRVERDMTLAEVEELSASKTSPNGDVPAATVGRSLTMRLDKIKTQYTQELVPLTQQREALLREVADLKTAREQFLEETTALSARNEELAQLGAHHARRNESAGVSDAPIIFKAEVHAPPLEKKSNSFDKSRSQPQTPAPFIQPSFSASSTSSATLYEDQNGSLGRNNRGPDMSTTPRPVKFKWPGSKAKDQNASHNNADHKGPGRLEHSFQQLSVLRFTRCDHCGDKMWGSQLRCTGCNVSVHVRCINHMQTPCNHQPSNARPDSQVQIVAMPPSMFGRDLTEQVRADAKGGDRQVPFIVEKCIDAVEATALDYEGIYRKTGGSGQSKVITQLFERGEYNTFDLRDQDQFNDICAVTSVLKNYFRSLPVPLMTYSLHEEFMQAASIKDSEMKHEALLDCVNKLPNEFYYTLRLLMLHLHNVREHSEVNLMNARNLGVVFGPTLMRSQDPAAEFSDMAGKAIAVEWLVENAPAVFAPPH